MKAVHPADLWERDLDAFLDAWDRFETNMTILDNCGVGGSAFRKPTLTAASKGEESKANSRAAQAKRDANREAFKKLQKLGPVKTSQPPPAPHPNRKEIILPEVKTDPIIPPSKVKKEDPSGEGGDTPKRNKAKSTAVGTGKSSILSYLKSEKAAPVKKELTEEEILALPLSERLALRAKSAVPSSSPIKSMTLDEFTADISDDDDEYGTTGKKKAKRPSSRITAAPIDLSDSDHKPVPKKPKATSSMKKTSSIKLDSDDDDGGVVKSAPAAKATKRVTAKASAKATAKSSARKRIDLDESDSDLPLEDSDDDEIVKPAAARPKRASAAKATSRMKVEDSESDSDVLIADSEDDEDTFKPAPRTKRASAAKATPRMKAHDSDSDSDIFMADSEDDEDTFKPASKSKR